MKNLIKAYIDYIKGSIVPKPYSHQVKMDINIKQGEQYGTALIPCTIYAMDHSIDLNPALVRKKDKKIMKVYQPGEKIDYNPNNYCVELTDAEKKDGYVLRELERCSHCGQKIVIAELAQTRYKSCPSISVKLGDKAKEDLIVPVQFGVNKSDITSKYWSTPIFYLVILLGTALLLGVDITKPLTDIIISLIPPLQGIATGNTIIWTLRIVCLAWVWVVLMPTFIYGNFKLFQWYNKVKGRMEKVEYKTQNDKWTQQGLPL